eukprot:3212378-Amphidinium_carterae.2
MSTEYMILIHTCKVMRPYIPPFSKCLLTDDTYGDANCSRPRNCDNGSGASILLWKTYLL